MILILYFSGTGNSRYIAELFAAGMNARCHSIEEAEDFDALIVLHPVLPVRQCLPPTGDDGVISPKTGKTI
ncbi:MAG: hypothetical protein PHZ09_04840 [Eubacteriales bacterium]|jgi:menaquinone-dependent protoporphyrinogen IX oxidase|nr:hypothetical protein [Eubacteriales bacterium]